MSRQSWSMETVFSCNGMYTPIGWGKMCKSKKYRAWLDKWIPYVKTVGVPVQNYPCDIEFAVVQGRNFGNTNDPNNIIKPMVDLLVKADILIDDSAKYNHRASVRYYPITSRGEALTVVTIIENERDFIDYGCCS